MPKLIVPSSQRQTSEGTLIFKHYLLFKWGWKSCDMFGCINACCHRNHFLPLPSVGDQRVWPLRFMPEIHRASLAVRSPSLRGGASDSQWSLAAAWWCCEVKIAHNKLIGCRRKDLSWTKWRPFVLKCHKWLKKKKCRRYRSFLSCLIAPMTRR